ncbi:hypothetical protein [Novosphingobium mathurense]|uniref:Uncharacterized protein n=1 Tax=Novosphingobium mathurense TaxID=428990 RepID=A0A1U6I6I6_9SPHN|nr:hypothetical protein [Novosphingobium mathurense]SLK03640.1 hypothetical protein SAMN06295987_104271 [Novosphingobium mathurense]
MTDINKLIERLGRKAYRREAPFEPFGTCDVPCDADDYGAEEYLINPDGPEAATALQTLKEENERLRHDIARHMEIANSEANRGEKLLAENERMAEALRRCADIVERHLYLQSEKVEDVRHIACASLPKETDNA